MRANYTERGPLIVCAAESFDRAEANREYRVRLTEFAHLRGANGTRRCLLLGASNI